MEQIDPEIETLCDLILSASDHTLERYQSEQDRFIARSRDLANAVKANAKGLLALNDLICAVKNFLEFHALDKHEQGPLALGVNIKFARETLKKAGVE